MSGSAFSVHPLTEELLAAAASLETSEIPGGMSPESFADSFHAPGSCALAALSPEGELLGFVLASQVLDEAEILSVAVSPSIRRQGIGTALLDALLAALRARGAGKIFLEVRSSNTPAQNLYRRYGFAEYGRRKNYYSHPREDAVLMVCTLSGERESYANSRN